ncbi:hypothetical protein F4604DRAFT_1675204 [Suillus subluteus]|nr:hypothetical protein F4604DRAFT_1675204 [Suillus subluteus]
MALLQGDVAVQVYFVVVVCNDKLEGSVIVGNNEMPGKVAPSPDLTLEVPDLEILPKSVLSAAAITEVLQLKIPPLRSSCPLPKLHWDVVILKGSNDFGALSVGTKQATATPAIVSSDHLTVEGCPINPRRTTAFGSNKKGQLHRMDSWGRVRQVGCTWNGTYLLRDEDDIILLSTGRNAHGQLGWESQVEENGVTGWNVHSHLGLDHMDDVMKPVKIWPAGGHAMDGRIARVWAGNGTSWILLQTQYRAMLKHDVRRTEKIANYWKYRAGQGQSSLIIQEVHVIMNLPDGGFLRSGEL